MNQTQQGRFDIYPLPLRPVVLAEGDNYLDSQAHQDEILSVEAARENIDPVGERHARRAKARGGVMERYGGKHCFSGTL